MSERTAKMLSANQIEAHVTRLTAVREGLRKFEGDDARAKDAGEVIEVAITTLQQDVPVPQKAAEEAAAPNEVDEDALGNELSSEESMREEAEVAVEIGEAEPTPLFP